jgi:RimJ/RimL family protein N-acetyltransferase/uncharacterized glyoxalase superfamily protein PhnB
MMEKYFETDRLVVRPYQPADAEAYFAIFNDRRAMRFMPTPPHLSLQETQAFTQAELDRTGAHLWSVCLKGDDRPIGRVDFLGETRIPGMGYILHPDYWGQGITPEACRPVVGYGFNALGYDRLELWIDETNSPSLRVAQKLGFRPKGRIPMKYSHKPAQHTMLIFGLLADEWREGDAQPQADTTHFFSVQPVLMVNDVQKTAEYYRDGLGFNIDFLYGDPPNHGAVSRGDWTGSMATIQLSQVSPDRELTPAGYLYILVDTSLDRLCETYRERGVEIISEPETHPWGMREFAVRDLNGQRLVFATHG